MENNPLFTVFVLDDTRDDRDPLVFSVYALQVEDIEKHVIASYYAHHDFGAHDENFQPLEMGGTPERQFWEYQNAIVVGAIPRRVEVVWDAEGLDASGYEALWGLRDGD